VTVTARKLTPATIASLFCGVVLTVVGFASVGRARPQRAVEADVEHGKYLVEEVAMCGECHTPRNDNGELEMGAWLQGASIWIVPTRHIQNWADRAPALAGLPSYTEEEMERVLEKGIGPEGEVLRPPMHIYHMVPADAKAIIAYLKSLPTPMH
jgi:mono/diheme cytochrome c family protein